MREIVERATHPKIRGTVASHCQKEQEKDGTLLLNSFVLFLIASLSSGAKWSEREI